MTEECPLQATGVDQEAATKLEAARCTWEFRTRSQRPLDGGKEPIEDAPLFGGERQAELF
jgi:hypothetical protein